MLNIIFEFICIDLGASISRLKSAIHPFPKVSSRCNNVSGLWTPCTCLLEMCIGWYPCGLKFCKGKIETGIGNGYRCGIKTCRKCYQLIYYVQQKQQCLWYDWPIPFLLWTSQANGWDVEILWKRCNAKLIDHNNAGLLYVCVRIKQLDNIWREAFHCSHTLFCNLWLIFEIYDKWHL